MITHAAVNLMFLHCRAVGVGNVPMLKRVALPPAAWHFSQEIPTRRLVKPPDLQPI
jgi:hypothetical protein